jgi:hypothetical protein
MSALNNDSHLFDFRRNSPSKIIPIAIGVDNEGQSD